MDFETLDKIARKNMLSRRSHAERETGFIYYHGQRVARGVIELRKRLTDDASHDDLLRCAAMFHDIGKGLVNHSATGAALARLFLSDLLKPEELDEVCRLIAAHDLRDPKSDKWDVWAKLLQDADLLDHSGSLEIWLNFHYYAHTGEPIQESVRFYQEEYGRQVEKQRSEINFDQSRQIFDEKIAFVHAFIQRMEVEAVGNYVL